MIFACLRVKFRANCEEERNTPILAYHDGAAANLSIEWSEM